MLVLSGLEAPRGGSSSSAHKSAFMNRVAPPSSLGLTPRTARLRLQFHNSRFTPSHDACNLTPAAVTTRPIPYSTCRTATRPPRGHDNVWHPAHPTPLSVSRLPPAALPRCQYTRPSDPPAMPAASLPGALSAFGPVGAVLGIPYTRATSPYTSGHLQKCSTQSLR